MTTFNAIDVETANSNRASICQIGIVQVSEGKIQREWSTLVDPEGPFEAMNISVHGIKQEDITDSPRLPEVYPTLHDLCRARSWSATPRSTEPRSNGRWKDTD